MTNRAAPRAAIRFALLLVLLIGGLLRVGMWTKDARLHPDEALFTAFARGAVVNGDWLLTGDLDKPPLSLYAVALSLGAAAVYPRDTVLDIDPRVGEVAARLPGWAASVLLIALAYRLAWRLYRLRELAIIAAGALALSPFALAFSAVVFTDALMLLCVTVALLVAVERRAVASALAIGAAFLIKPQALYALPLIVLVIAAYAERQPLRAAARMSGALIVGILGALGVLFLWEAARAVEPDVLTLAIANNPTPIAPVGEWLPRFFGWFQLGRLMFGTPTLIIAIAALIVLVVGAVRGWQTRDARIDAALALFIAGYLALHVVVAFPLYDRYLLPLLIPSVLLAARGWVALVGWLSGRLIGSEVILVTLIVAITIGAGALEAVNVCPPVGGDGGNGRCGVYDDIAPLADHLWAKPVATVVYDHWLGWSLRYYMGAWHDKRITYYPTPEALARDAAALPEREVRYLPVPTGIDAAAWRSALEGVGFTITIDLRLPGFIVYALTPPADGR